VIPQIELVVVLVASFLAIACLWALGVLCGYAAGKKRRRPPHFEYDLEAVSPKAEARTMESDAMKHEKTGLCAGDRTPSHNDTSVVMVPDTLPSLAVRPTTPNRTGFTPLNLEKLEARGAAGSASRSRVRNSRRSGSPATSPDGFMSPVKAPAHRRNRSAEVFGEHGRSKRLGDRAKNLTINSEALSVDAYREERFQRGNSSARSLPKERSGSATRAPNNERSSDRARSNRPGHSGGVDAEPLQAMVALDRPDRELPPPGRLLDASGPAELDELNVGPLALSGLKSDPPGDAKELGTNDSASSKCTAPETCRSEANEQTNSPTSAQSSERDRSWSGKSSQRPKRKATAPRKRTGQENKPATPQPAERIAQPPVDIHEDADQNISL